MNFSFVLQEFDQVLLEVLTAVTPVLGMFLLFVLIYKLPKNLLLILLKGVLFAFAGLALFLQGVKVGFMPVGTEMGSVLGGMPDRWILIPIGFLLGFVATLAEPAVRILCHQVEDTSSGAIKSNLILYTLCLAVGIFIALAMTRIIYGIPFYYIIIPGYMLAIILMIFSKPSFTAVAFDSGGVATGPMTVTFIMALAVGAADTMEGRDAVVDGFGLIALVALAPIIMVMLLGFLFPEEEAEQDPYGEDLETESDHGDKENEGTEKHESTEDDQSSEASGDLEEAEVEPYEESNISDDEKNQNAGNKNEEDDNHDRDPQA